MTAMMTMLVSFLVGLLVLTVAPEASSSKKPDNALKHGELGVVDVFSANMTVGSRTYYCVKIPTILKTADGSLLAFGEARIGSCEDVAGTDLIYRRSSDYGMTWGPAQLLHSNSSDGETNVIGNAAPVVNSEGRIFLPFTRNNRETWMMSSDDHGVSWSAPVSMPHLQLDEWVWIGLGPPSGLRLASGRLLIPGYHGHVPLSDESSIGSAVTKGHTLLSDDDGSTWRLGCESFGDPYLVNELQAAQLADGTIIINAREVNDKRALAFSSDEGETFPRVSQASTLHETFQGCEGSTIADLAGERLFYSGVQGRLPGRIYRENLTLFESIDGGSSWELQQVIEPGSSAYSALTWLNGSIGVLYERATCLTNCPLIFLPDFISWRLLSID